MKKTTIISLERLTNTFSGNPRFEIETTIGTFKTKANAGFAYSITDNYAGKDVAIEISGKLERITDLKLI